MIRVAEQSSQPAGSSDFTATRNACKLCTPLGACLAFAGVEGAVPFLHGSQGCATYIRRYMISHFREPMDIASSSFGEHATIFGGQENLRQGLGNVIDGYGPTMIGIATTCLSETIGDDVPMFLHEFRQERVGRTLPELVHVSTPSYAGTHAEGYIATVRAIVNELASEGEPTGAINLIPAMLSPADLRHLKRVCEDFAIDATLLPDYADRMDGPSWETYQRIPDGGTPVEAIRRMGRARATLEFAATPAVKATAGALLSERFGVEHLRMPIPIGVELNDLMFERLSAISNRCIPARYESQRGRLIDAYVDSHKYLSGRRAIVFGEEDLCVSLCAFLTEIGIEPALVASGGRSGRLAQMIAEVAPAAANAVIEEDCDHERMAELATEMPVDLIIGSSKGYGLARHRDLPLVRVGFPIHDRFGGARIQHVGYAGTQQLLDRIVNALLDRKQSDSEIGFTYL